VRELDALNASHGSVKETWEQVTLICKRQDLKATRQTLKKRAEDLYEAFKAGDIQKYRRSGTEEEWSEREALLSELKELEADALSATPVWLC